MTVTRRGFLFGTLLAPFVGLFRSSPGLQPWTDFANFDGRCYSTWANQTTGAPLTERSIREAMSALESDAIRPTTMAEFNTWRARQRMSRNYMGFPESRCHS